MNDVTKRGFSLAEAITYTGRPRSALFASIQTGELRSYKVSSRRFFLREDLDAYLAFLTTPGRQDVNAAGSSDSEER